MKQIFQTYPSRLLLCLLFTIIGGGNFAWGDTYEQLTSIASIDESAKYVLGIDGTGFHYDGTSSWGMTALPSKQTPLYYTLTKAADFISMMRSSLPEQKLIAAKQIPFIAEQIGPERTVNELLPFLPGMLSDMYVFS